MRKSFIIALVCLSLLLTVLVAQKINLAVADIGRHIKNGEMMLNAGEMGFSRSALLRTNFYSYTESDTPFVNHHWASGILFYFIFSLFGWSGLSFFHILIFVLAFAILFLLSHRKLPLLYLIPLSIFLLPLIAERTEIRPETFSYLFIAVFIYLLTRFAENDPSKKFLYLLPILFLFWANLHIYFVFGLFIIGAYLLERIIHKDWEKTRVLASILIFSVVATFITPFGPKALLYPFTIFQDYGYRLVENQSIPFLENIGFVNPSFIWWKIAAGFGILLSLWTLVRRPRQFPIALGIIAFAFGFLSFSAIRNFSVFGLVLLPYLAYIFSAARNSKEKAFRSSTEREPATFSAGNDSVLFLAVSDKATEVAIASSITISFLLLIIIPIRFSANTPWSPTWGVGLMSGVNDSAEFVREHNIQGPIFSNYDIGGYLIYHLFPAQKVFVDNRPEAYSVEFFQNVYIPMQEKQEVWEKVSSQYNFNTIWFYRHDLTPWSQQFLIQMVNDPVWAPVFVDDYTIIFLKRTIQNTELIQKFELPKSLFSIK